MTEASSRERGIMKIVKDPSSASRTSSAQHHSPLKRGEGKQAHHIFLYASTIACPSAPAFFSQSCGELLADLLEAGRERRRSAAAPSCPWP